MIEFAAESHPGNRYQHNEDSLGWVEAAGVWLVADGMGGHACGDVASRTVKQSLLQASAAAQDLPAPPSLPDLISKAHAAVVAEGIRRSAENMGSTVVMVRISGSRAEVGWCGDSRLYLWRDQQLIRLTRDHSLLEQLLESGVVDQAEAFGHPQKHVLVQALGITNPEPAPSELAVDLADNDLLLLCSDGLHDELRDDEIGSLLAANPEPAEAVGALVARTLLGDARDNISVVCIRLTNLEMSQPALSVEQLRQRYERLPGRRPDRAAVTGNATPAGTPAAAVADSDSPPDVSLTEDDLGGVAPAPRVAAAAKIKLPTKSSGGASAKAEPEPRENSAEESPVKQPAGLDEFDRDLLIALTAVALLLALVAWTT